MFKYLRDKIKNAVSNISKEAEEKTEIIEEKEEIVEKPEEKKIFSKLFGKKKVEPEKKEIEKPIDEKIHETEEKSEPIKEEIEQEITEPSEEILEKVKEEIDKPIKKEEKIIKEIKPLETDEEFEKIEQDLEEDKKELEQIFEKKGFFSKVKEAITKKSLSENQFEELFFQLELGMLENNVAIEVIEKIKNDLKKELVDSKVLRGKVKDIIEKTLAKSLNEILSQEINILEKIKSKKPFIILFIGINGTGKTTSVAKFANYLKQNNISCVLAAADTFRAAAIQQLEEHATKLDLKIIKQDYGSDPAAVAFDAIKYAESKKIDVVLIDTAGRQHSNSNLMDELRKVNRVSNPDMKIFVGDSLTGNDCVEQATKFNEAINIDANILTKVDVDEKGGAAISVSYVTGKPIIFIGTGQKYEDFELFDKKIVLENLGLN